MRTRKKGVGATPGLLSSVEQHLYFHHIVRFAISFARCGDATSSQWIGFLAHAPCPQAIDFARRNYRPD